MATTTVSATGPSPAAADVVAEAARRRTFAVISHPDAGKSTLTEALALHARVIGQAGAVHGKAGRRGTVSDWMDMERDRVPVLDVVRAHERALAVYRRRGWEAVGELRPDWLPAEEQPLLLMRLGAEAGIDPRRP